MTALWLALVPVAIVGGYFLVKAFRNVNKALRELQGSMRDLGQAGADLKKVQDDLAGWREALERSRRQ